MLKKLDAFVTVYIL